MRTRDPAITAHYATRSGRLARLLVWISGRNRSTGATETLGFWTGDDHTDFDINGQSRLYYGAGSVVQIEPLVFRTGLRVNSQRITLSPIAPEVETAIRLYDPRLAPVEMHVVDFDPVTGNLLAAPERIFKGILSGAPVTTPPLGGDATCEIELLGAAQSLRRTLALKKSDESLQARAPSDRFRRYTDITGAVETYWGEARAAAPKPTEPVTPAETGDREAEVGK